MSRANHKRTAHRWQVGAMLIGAVVLALGSFWLVQVINGGDIGKASDPLKGEPDYTVEKFSFVRMTPAGKPRYIISGDKLTHRPDNDVSDVERPVMQNMSEVQQPTTITANHARIDQVRNVVELQENVNIERPASAAGQRLRLKTEALTVLPDDEQMKTAAPVEMLSGANTITGVGMFADNAARHVNIASRVRIELPPPPRR